MDKAAESYRRYLSGEKEASYEVMDELFRGLVFFIDRYIRDVHASEDVALDVMTDLFVRKPRFNFKNKLKTYVYMRGKSRALDYLRRVKAHKLCGIEEAEQLPDERLELETAVLADERMRTVNAALEKLPEDMRTAVHLVFFERMTYKEAAAVMKKSVKQVDNLLYRAKNELRELIGEEGAEFL